MTKSDLIEALTLTLDHLKPKQVEDAVKNMLEDMSATLEEGNRIEIRGFGSFTLHHRTSRIGRNPKTGEQVHLDSRSIPYFKPGKEMREAVNNL